MIRICQSSDIEQGLDPGSRRTVADPQIEEMVAEIIRRVIAEGDAALREFTSRFDQADIDEFKVGISEIEAAWQDSDEQFRAILSEAAANIRAYHQHQLRQDVVMEKPEGIILGQRLLPLERVGIYVPGGTAAYPSTVLMNAIPAAIAGVERIVMVTPPAADGKINADILVAAKIAGITDIYKLGGSQAIAALAYGTESIPQVDKIVGPGNIYVATAKRQVFGQVDIDMIAGPSEILIIADESANPAYIAADMLAQAEHDIRAASMLICPNQSMAEQVVLELNRQLTDLPRREIANASLANEGWIIIEPELDLACELANTIASEHLELAVRDPFSLLPKIRHAGSIFLGSYTPEALGDYWAGPNHVLPTCGSARFASALSVDDFVKRSSYIYYSQQALAKAAHKVSAFARHEGLDAHAKSIMIRQEKEK